MTRGQHKRSHTHTFHDTSTSATSNGESEPPLKRVTAPHHHFKPTHRTGLGASTSYVPHFEIPSQVPSSQPEADLSQDNHSYDFSAPVPAVDDAEDPAYEMSKLDQVSNPKKRVRNVEVCSLSSACDMTTDGLSVQCNEPLASIPGPLCRRAPSI
jgi:hypothetical protein